MLKNHSVSRRSALGGLGAIALTSLSRMANTADPLTLDVMRNPGCGCCEVWADGLRAAGFNVKMTDNPDLNGYRASLGVPSDLAGCHTGKIDGYIIEGHVPAADVAKLLKERPEALGISVAGMPLGSPGMEMGGEKEPFDVVLFKGDGSRSVFAKY